MQTRPISNPAGSRWTSSRPFPSSCPQTRANYSRGTGLFAVSNFPRLRVGQESCDNSFPRLRVGQESRRETFPPFGRDKNRAAKPSRRSGETRIAPRNLPAAWERQESRRETFPPPGRDKNRAAKPSRRSGETRIAPRNLPAERFESGNSVSSLPPSGLEQETRVFPFPPLGRDKKRA